MSSGDTTAAGGVKVLHKLQVIVAKSKSQGLNHGEATERVTSNR